MPAFAVASERSSSRRPSQITPKASCHETQAVYQAGNDSLCAFIERTLSLRSDCKVTVRINQKKSHKKKKRETAAPNNAGSTLDLSIRLTEQTPQYTTRGELAGIGQGAGSSGGRPPYIVATETVLRGRMLVRLTIGANGSVSQVTVKESQRDDNHSNPAADSLVRQLESEIVRLFRATDGQWTPAEANEEETNSTISILIRWCHITPGSIL